MPERIVVIGDLLYGYEKWGERDDGYALFDRYKDTWVDEVMDSQDGEFYDDLFDSFDEYLEFWGTEHLDEAQGSVYAKKYKNFTDEDEKFYKKVVDDAQENEKKNIKILKGHEYHAKLVKMRCKYKWQEMKKKKK